MLAPQGVDDKQICRLDIPVDNSLGVGRGQGRRRLLGKGHHLFGGQAIAAGFGEIALQRLSRSSSITR